MPPHPVESGNDCGTGGGGRVMEERTAVFGKGDFNSLAPHGETVSPFGR